MPKAEVYRMKICKDVQSGSYNDGRYDRLAISLKGLVIGEAIVQESVPKRNSSERDLPRYQWNTKKMRKSRFCACNMAGLKYERLN